MCGLSGCAGDLTNKEERAFKTLLMFSQVRGVDSTGVGSVVRTVKDGSREVRLAKETGPPYFLMDRKAFDQCFYGQLQVLIGHNRSKTVGEVTRKNAHPFWIEDVIGAHNGTIDFTNKNRLERGSEFRTDSEAIINNIQVHGIKDTISRISKSEAYALVWYDGRDNTINLLRNDHRQLWYIYSANKKCIFWASEYEILMAALLREGIDLKDQKCVLLTPDFHYKWTLPASCNDELPEPVKTKMENFTWANQRNDSWKKNGNTSSNIYDFGDEYDWTGYADGYPRPGSFSNVQSTTETPTVPVNNIVKEAAKIIQDAEKAIQNFSKIDESKIMSPNDFLRKNKLVSARKILIDKPEKMPIIYENKSMIVHRDRDTGQWHTLRWNTERLEWEKFITSICPYDVPFNTLDINARHNFKHQGKGKRKKIYYKGFQGSLIDQDQFNKFMKSGCYNPGCNRIPEWGNEVTFLDHEHTFLCEYCSMTPHLVKDLIQDRKRAG